MKDHQWKSKRSYQMLVQFVKFGIVGLTNTIISYIFNVLTIYLLSKAGFTWDYIAGNVVGFITGTVWSFFWNDRFVFTDSDKESSKGKILLKSFLIYGFTIVVISNLLSYVWINVFGISKYIAPIINLFISVPLNFFLNKYWAFKEGKKGS